MKWFPIACLLGLLLAACGGSGGDTPTAQHARGAASLYFDGSDDVMTVANASWGSTSYATGMTLEAWIRPQTLVASPDFAAIVDANRGILTLDDDFAGSNQTRFAMTVSHPGTNSTYSGLGALQAGVWQHVAGTFDGTDIRLYLNGSLVSSQAHPGTPGAAPDLIVGRWSTSFHGRIDEVRVWNVARSASDIAGAMDVALTGSEAGLLAYYRFEGTGQTTVDSSTRNADGVLGSTAAPEANDPARVSN